MGLKPRQWVILLTFYTIYLMFGASVFYHIEHAAETDRRSKELQDRMAINGMYVLDSFVCICMWFMINNKNGDDDGDRERGALR